MQVNPVSTQSAPAAPAASAAASAASVDFQSFLRLLTAQLRYQDPLSPLDSTQFVSQLASFSSVEQLVSANARLDAIASAIGGSSLQALSTWIGRNAETTDSPAVFDGAPAPFRLDPNSAAVGAELVVRDASGVEIDRRAVANSAGVQFWDGEGAPSPGAYTFSIEFALPDGSIEPAPAAVFSRIIGVRDGANGAQLLLASGATLAPSQVRSLLE